MAHSLMTKQTRTLRYNRALDERQLEIDKNIPIPFMPPNNRFRVSKLRKTLEDMESGDSLLLRGEEQYSRANNARSRITRSSGAKFFIKKMSATTWRIWRVS